MNIIHSSRQNNQNRLLVFLIILLPVIIFIIYNSYLSGISMKNSDLYNNMLSYKFKSFKQKPTLYIISLVFKDFVYVYLISLFVIITAYINILKLICKNNKYIYYSVFLLFVNPYAVPIFYGNVLYNGVALALIAHAIIYKNIFLKLVLVLIAIGIHFKVVIFFIVFFIIPYLLYNNLQKVLFYLYLFLMLLSVYIIINIDIMGYGAKDIFLLDDKMLFSAQKFIISVREDIFTRLKIAGFLIFVLILINNYRMMYLSDKSKKLLICTNLTALVLLTIPGIPFIERFVLCQIQYSFIILTIFIVDYLNKNIIKT